jgi:hypothetical protein
MLGALKARPALDLGDIATADDAPVYRLNSFLLAFLLILGFNAIST